MKKLITLIKIIIFIIAFYIIFIAPRAEGEKADYFYMTVTAYSLHSNCISGKHNDGMTASNTPIREGVVAINVDYIDGRWLIKSPLNLGDEIYIEGMGNYLVEDTGYFTDIDYKQDFWNIDVYMEDYEKAIEFGRKLKKVYVLKEAK